jgi:energy-coupling factor transporter ATP-binding protein EcfA2
VVALTEPRVTSESLTRLAATLESLEFGSEAASLASDRDRLVGTIRSYLIPRVLDPDLPTTVVVAGPTGSGKSTVVNSLCGADVSRTGTLRPTTRMPVVVAGHEYVGRFEEVGDVPCETVEIEASVLETMVLVDTPDIDSTSTRHRAMAEGLIDNADVVVFVTSALRYADEVPWQVLRRAQSRGAPVIQVLNRVGSESAGSTIDFKSRLSSAGMDDDVVVVPEFHLADGTHHVPNVAVESLRSRLDEVAARREVFAGEAFRRVLSATIPQVIALTDTIAGIQRDIDRFESDLSERLIGRGPEVAFGETGRGLYPPPPTNSSRRSLRRWRRRARAADAVARVAEMHVIERMVTVVNSDVRAWVIEQRLAFEERGIEPPLVIEGVTPAIRSAIGGWVDYVVRIALDAEEADARLGAAVLIHAATSVKPVPAIAAMFDEYGQVLVDRARRELLGRLEVVYRLVATVAADILRGRYCDLDDTDLRASVGAVTATLAPVHA